uniref:Uncharacterized protein n=1 Tax=Myotis myotis TaxID=51298 RepID=A0A7J7WVG6_MYOMY|nr:hypothetical protein mMyoMyo1_011855 [Myotis myotis]
MQSARGTCAGNACRRRGPRSFTDTLSLAARGHTCLPSSRRNRFLGQEDRVCLCSRDERKRDPRRTPPAPSSQQTSCSVLDGTGHSDSSTRQALPAQRRLHVCGHQAVLGSLINNLEKQADYPSK